MKTQITDIKQLIGQTITGVNMELDRLVISTPESFLSISSEGYDNRRMNLEVETRKFWDRYTYLDYDQLKIAVEAGAVTSGEVDSIILAHEEKERLSDEARETAREERERAEYARLKAKFEPEGGK